MSYSWRSADEFRSAKYPAVTYRVSRMSMARRLELTRQVKDLLRRTEFLRAGAATEDQVEAALLAGEMDRLYWQSGLEALDGIEIDGAAATPETQFERGPEDLSREILDRIRQHCQLSDEERKN